MLKFVPDSTRGLGQKRKHLPKACDECRKRRKRCYHHSEASQNAAASGQAEPPGSPAAITTNGRVVSSHGIGRSHTRTASADDPESSHFMGHLNPETVFADQTLSRNSVGVWLQSNWNRQSHAPKSAIIQSQIPALRQESVSITPDFQAWDKMQMIYFEKLYPLVPILSETALRRLEGLERITLQQCICLGAASQPEAKPWCRLLKFGETVLEPSEFSKELVTAVKTTLDLGLIQNKLVLVQASALMFLHYNGPHSSDASSYYCTMAVHHAQTIGLHIRTPNGDASLKNRLFYCIWAIDRINGTINGRPLLYHDRDVEIDIAGAFKDQAPAFQVFLAITMLLDKTIALYRPSYHVQQGQDFHEFPQFEHLVADAAAYELEESLSVSLELYYHVVSILRCRKKDLLGSEHENPLLAAQMFSASRLTSIVDEYGEAISMTPLAPYGLSLALSVAFKDLRSTKLPQQRRRAMSAFQSNAKLLGNLGKTFGSARLMADLAHKTLTELERIEDGSGSVLRRHAPTPAGHAKTIAEQVSELRPVADDILQNISTTSSVAPDPSHLGIHPAVQNDDDFLLQDIDAAFDANLDLTLPLFESWDMYSFDNV